MMWRQQPFFQVALPIIITFVIATLYQNSRMTDLRDAVGKRIDDLRDSVDKRFDAVDKRLSSIEDLG